MCSPDRVVLEQEAMQAIAVVHCFDVGLEPDLRAQLAFQQVVHLRRIRLAARGLHDLADEEAEQLVLAASGSRASCPGFFAITSSMAFSMAPTCR